MDWMKSIFSFIDVIVAESPLVGVEGGAAVGGVDATDEVGAKRPRSPRGFAAAALDLAFDFFLFPLAMQYLDFHGLNRGHRGFLFDTRSRSFFKY
jgi:hypothetical protein